MNRGLKFWLCFALSVVLAIYFAVRITMTLMGNGMPVKKVNIYAIPGDANVEALRNITADKNASLEDIMNRIIALPDTEFAAVRKMANGNLDIKIQNRTALAAWMNGSDFYPLTSDGTIINKASQTRPANMIVFRGKISGDLENIVRAMRAFPGIAQNTDYLEQVEDRRWNIITLNRAKIMLPEGNFDRALETLAELEKGQSMMSRDFATLDMRDPARILVH